MRGTLVHSRVVDDPGTALAAALDRGLTGYAVFSPAGTLLLDSDDEGVLAFDGGVPVAAHHAGTDRGGPDAVAGIAGAGPYRAELYDDPGAPADPPGAPVAPGVPAEVLAADPALADRTREAAPPDADPPGESSDALEAFLANEGKIAAIQERAREEAARRAEEWGLDLADDEGGEAATGEGAAGDTGGSVER